LKKFSGFAGWVSQKAEANAVEGCRQQLKIDCHDVSQSVGELSGGHQQKGSIARWWLTEGSILLFDEPTRGVDIQTKTVIYGLLTNLKLQGKALVIVSSESRELTELSDRIAVLSNGRLAAVYGRGEWTSEKIMAASFSEHLDHKRTLN
jgi:ribose transport system ATP-binding protein